MNKTILLMSILLSINLFSKTPEQHDKEAEEYSQKSKQGLIFAAVALVFVIGVKYLNKQTDKNDNG